MVNVAITQTQIFSAASSGDGGFLEPSGYAGWPASYDPVYGARPLKRAVQKYLQDPLADMILKGEIHDRSTVKVDEGDGGLKLTVE